jgi:hypothetical protein
MVTGLEVTEELIIVQYYIDSGIDVYDRSTKQLLFRSNFKRKLSSASNSSHPCMHILTQKGVLLIFLQFQKYF